MKTFKKFFLVLTVFIAGKCFKKLTSRKTVDINYFISILNNPNIDIFGSNYNENSHFFKPGSSKLFNFADRGRAIEIYNMSFELMRLWKESGLEGKAKVEVSFFEERYFIAKGLNLNFLIMKQEKFSKITTKEWEKEDEKIYKYQWID